MKAAFILVLAFLLAGIYFGLQPSETVRLRGIEGDVVMDEYSVFVRAQGNKGDEEGRKVFSDPPYTFTLRIMPEDETVQYVELDQVLVFACGDSIKLHTYKEQLIHVWDYHDNKKPLALYKLKGEVPCHGKVIMDLAFILRDGAKNEVASSSSRVLVETYDYVPTTLGYWWANALSR